jgi:hypothetical protein
MYVFIYIFIYQCVYVYLEGALLVLGGEEQHQGQGLGALRFDWWCGGGDRGFVCGDVM